ncbi:ETHYLENE-RESPONSIVE TRANSCRIPTION FACTOR [Salix viminalis]|uniref:ETHYLENE-RESPONSIVE TRANSCRIPTION FACTOR n=1 Tax=Salix viminalis TaxID=40686 RepID=A0A9Q0QBR9_SALVM|nr:ETHYLENE-RESPONSIVE TRANSCRIPTION FACTOR [Salix viminalis]
MERVQENNLSFAFNRADIGSSLSQLIMTGGTSTLDSIFSHCQPARTLNSPVLEPLGSSVYLRQRDLLQKFSEENRINTPLISQLANKPSSKSCAHQQLFGSNQEETIQGSQAEALGQMDCGRLDALKNTVDAKIQAICQKVKRERAEKNAAKKSDANGNCTRSKKPVKVDSNASKPSPSSSSSSVSPLFSGDNWGGSELVSPAVSEDGFWKCESSSSPSVSTDCAVMVPQAMEFEDCSLARMPSYDPELIWEVLAN